MRTPFFGASYKAKYTNIAANRLVNLYPEIVENRSAAKAVGSLLTAPGLDFLATIGAGPVRGFYVQGANCFVVSGNTVYSFNASFTVTTYGTLNTSSGPVSIISNVIGTLSQVAIFDGNAGWLVQQSGASGVTYQQINLPFGSSPPGGYPVSATYQDTFGLVNVSGTNLWYQSNPGDLSVWAALDFSAADAFPDNVLALISVHQEIWLLKQNDIEIWIDEGNAGFSFSRNEGTFIESGIIAPATVCKGGEALFWLGGNPQGAGIAAMATTYQPTRISDHAVESIWQKYPTMSDALGWCYQQEGHLFYVLTFPSANATWVYDVTASNQLGEPCWHERAALENGSLGRHWANCFVYFNGLSIVGDYRNGNIYAQNLGAQTDNGHQRKWLRSWRALAQPSEAQVKFSSLRVDMLTGINVPDGSAPEIMLRYSDDGGYTWSTQRFAAAGPPGRTAQRVKFNQLGSTRKNSGLDRIFELSSTDAFGVSLVGAELE